MVVRDIFSQAWNTVKSNKLRSGITIAIIAFGIMALIGIITAIAAMNKSLQDSFATMGANSFTIRFRDINFGRGNNDVKKTSSKDLKKKKSNENKIITFDQARLFKQRFRFPARVSLSVNYRNVTVNTDKQKTNPNIMLIGVDENYLMLSGYDLELGRNFNELDVQSGKNVCIIGNSVAQTLYGDETSRAVDKIINVAGIKYRVIGVLKNKGSSSFLNADNIVLTTYNNLRRIFQVGNSSFNIGVRVNDIKLLDAAISEAKGTFRPIRNLQIEEQNNFYILKSDSIAEVFINSLGAVTTAAGFIGLITLISAAIGLMNIMLVAVNERTREIGLIKAIGGKAKSIKFQFLVESVLISLMGALFGIVLGISVGNIVGYLLHVGFVIPWAWVIAGVVTCSIVGLAAGLYPAIKASKLDPIVALRYE
ncbi:MAG: ABC transporter permease [Chitinophagaceae bacterium]|nr:ABC transporter permease [Chitinophagaceae bacterium]